VTWAVVKNKSTWVAGLKLKIVRVNNATGVKERDRILLLLMNLNSLDFEVVSRYYG